jgi:hypothetical protein
MFISTFVEGLAELDVQPGLKITFIGFLFTIWRKQQDIFFDTWFMDTSDF